MVLHLGRYFSLYILLGLAFCMKCFLALLPLRAEAAFGMSLYFANEESGRSAQRTNRILVFAFLIPVRVLIYIVLLYYVRFLFISLCFQKNHKFIPVIC